MENREIITKIYIGNTLADLKNSYTSMLYAMLNAGISIYNDDYQVRLDEHEDEVTIDLPHVRRTIEMETFIDDTYPLLKEMVLPLGMYLKKDTAFCKLVLDTKAEGTDGYCFVYLIPQAPLIEKKGIASQEYSLDAAPYIRMLLTATRGFGLLTFDMKKV